MWQVDNDRYQLGRLEHELGQKSVERLLNSVTTTDRSPPLGFPAMRFDAAVRVSCRSFRWLYCLVATPHMVRHAPE